MKALITGSSGYIGSHLKKMLIDNGWEVVGLDIRDADINLSIDDSFELQSGFDMIFHMAARTSVEEGERDKAAYIQTNINGTAHVLEAEKTGIPIVFSSTAAVYHPLERRLNERDQCLPASVYGRTKLRAEEMIRDSGRRHTILRYFNVAGCGDGMTDNLNRPITHLIPAIINGGVVNVYGTDYKTRDGSAVRDYVHVQDICRAHLRAAERLLDGKENLTCNIGSGTGHSVLEVINTAKRLGFEFTTQYQKRRDGDTLSLVSDISLAKQELGYEPEFNLEDILRTHRLS